MKNFVDFLYRFASVKMLIVAVVAYAVFPAYFLKNAETRINQLTGKPVEIIDLGIGFNPERTRQLLDTYTPEARAYYASVEATIDVAYPIVYAFLFAIIIALLYRQNRHGLPRWIVALPFVGLLFDYTENFFIYQLLAQYPDISDTQILLCEAAKLGKWVVLGAVLLLIGYGLVRRLMPQK
jgi:hypothetical protein